MTLNFSSELTNRTMCVQINLFYSNDSIGKVENMMSADLYQYCTDICLRLRIGSAVAQW